MTGAYWLRSTSASPAWAATSSWVRQARTRSSTSWPSSTARSGSTLSWSQSVITTTLATAYSPVAPSSCSRRMSAWPTWRPVSSIMWVRIQRRFIFQP